MSLGLVGAHRVGKTTLAAAVSGDTDLPLVLTSTSAVFKERGIDPAQPMTFFERLEIQDLVLDSAIEHWKGERGFFCTDRTPVDMLAYTLADVTGEIAADEVTSKRLERYTNRCYEALNEFFTVLVQVQPGIPIVADPHKATAALNRSYMEHLNALMTGLLIDERNKVTSFFLSRDKLHIEDRVNSVMRCIYKVEQRSGYDPRTVVLH